MVIKLFSGNEEKSGCFLVLDRVQAQRDQPKIVIRTEGISARSIEDESHAHGCVTGADAGF